MTNYPDSLSDKNYKDWLIIMSKWTIRNGNVNKSRVIINKERVMRIATIIVNYVLLGIIAIALVSSDDPSSNAGLLMIAAPAIVSLVFAHQQK